MASILDDYIDSLISKKKENKQKITDFIDKLKKNSKKINNKSRNRFEIEKNRINLKKKYYELGKYISNKFINDDMSDFSYEEKYNSLNKEIEKIKDYIFNIKKTK